MTAFDHIVLISLDTLRADCIGASPLRLWPMKYDVTTRLEATELDALAEGGCFFANGITAAPYTSAAHATVLTGCWPLRHGVYEFFNRSLAVPTLFTWARRQRARTIMKVDFPIILGRFLGFDKDVDSYLVEDDQGFLDAIGACNHTVSLVHFGGLHIPYGFHNLQFGGEAYIRKVEALETEVESSFALPQDQLVETYRSKEDLRLLLRYKRIVEYFYSRSCYDRLFDLYLEGLNHFLTTRFEPFIKRLLSRLAGSRYLLVLFGDHGEEYDADSYGHHNTLSEGVIRVPIVFYGPDIPCSTHLTRVRTVDLLPTILDWAGCGTMPDMDGSSLAATVLTGSAPPVHDAFAQAYTNDTAEFVAFQAHLLESGEKPGLLRHVLYKEAVYEERFKLQRQKFRYSGGGGIWGLEACAAIERLERFDDAFHPHAYQDEGIRLRMASKLDRFNSQVAAPGERVELTDALRDQLRALGYRL